MVNYCIVYGCGRNSRSNTQINFFSLPKDKNRQEQWLRAAGREDLLTRIKNVKCKPNYRICSKHFTPADVTNKHLIRYAVPKLLLPGSSDHVWIDESDSDNDKEHQDIVCNSCGKQVTGFRYKCVTCENYDICPKCEMMEMHDHHYMLRIPKPMKYKLADNMVQKWKKFLEEEHIACSRLKKKPDAAEVSSDDEPITKYAKSYDSGIDLSDDVKFEITQEVERAITRVNEIEQENVNKKQQNAMKKRKLVIPESVKVITHAQIQTEGVEIELVFADVNELNNDLDLEVKNEMSMGSLVDVSTGINEPNEETKRLEPLAVDGPSNDTKTCLLRELLSRDAGV